jgi:hypothetical protein
MIALTSSFGKLALYAACFALAACSRRVEIEDDGQVPTVPGESPLEFDGSVTLLDAGFDSDAFLPCGERVEGKCRGANDFVCEFGSWVPLVVRECQSRTGCKANGWMTVEIDDQGCAKNIGMDTPEADFAACVIQEFGSHECPCNAQSVSHFLGFGNAGCVDGSQPPAGTK